MEPTTLEFARQIGASQLGFWSSVASIAGLFGILLNTWRLSKAKAIVEEDRFKIAETMKPFDLYFNIQKATHLLRQQQINPFLQHEERDSTSDLLKNLGEVAGCLRQYFRDVHKIRNIRGNAYVDAGHMFLVKNDPEAAEEYYERALVEADAHNNKRDLSECLQGLKMCSALLGDQEFFDDLDDLADKLNVPIRPRNGRFFAGIQRVALKIAFKTQLFVRRNTLRKSRAVDASRLIVQIRSHLSQYEITSSEVTQRASTLGSPSVGEKPEASSRSAARQSTT
jgi:hypothetical protein